MLFSAASASGMASDGPAVEVGAQARRGIVKAAAPRSNKHNMKHLTRRFDEDDRSSVLALLPVVVSQIESIARLRLETIGALLILLPITLFLVQNPMFVVVLLGVSLFVLKALSLVQERGLLSLVMPVQQVAQLAVSDTAKQSVYDMVVTTSLERLQMAKKLMRVGLLVSNQNMTREEINYIVQNDQEYLDLFRKIVGKPLVHYLPLNWRRLLFGTQILEDERDFLIEQDENFKQQAIADAEDDGMIDPFGGSTYDESLSEEEEEEDEEDEDPLDFDVLGDPRASDTSGGELLLEELLEEELQASSSTSPAAVTKRIRRGGQEVDRNVISTSSSQRAPSTLVAGLGGYQGDTGSGGATSSSMLDSTVAGNTTAGVGTSSTSSGLRRRKLSGAPNPSKGSTASPHVHFGGASYRSGTSTSMLSSATGFADSSSPSSRIVLSSAAGGRHTTSKRTRVVSSFGSTALNSMVGGVDLGGYCKEEGVSDSFDFGDDDHSGLPDVVARAVSAAVGFYTSSFMSSEFFTTREWERNFRLEDHMNFQLHADRDALELSPRRDRDSTMHSINIDVGGGLSDEGVGVGGGSSSSGTREHLQDQQRGATSSRRTGVFTRSRSNDFLDGRDTRQTTGSALLPSSNYARDGGAAARSASNDAVTRPRRRKFSRGGATTPPIVGSPRNSAITSKSTTEQGVRGQVGGTTDNAEGAMSRSSPLSVYRNKHLSVIREESMNSSRSEHSSTGTRFVSSSTTTADAPQAQGLGRVTPTPVAQQGLEAAVSGKQEGKEDSAELDSTGSTSPGTSADGVEHEDDSTARDEDELIDVEEEDEMVGGDKIGEDGAIRTSRGNGSRTKGRVNHASTRKMDNINGLGTEDGQLLAHQGLEHLGGGDSSSNGATTTGATRVVKSVVTNVRSRMRATLGRGFSRIADRLPSAVTTPVAGLVRGLMSSSGRPSSSLFPTFAGGVRGGAGGLGSSRYNYNNMSNNMSHRAPGSPVRFVFSSILENTPLPISDAERRKAVQIGAKFLQKRIREVEDVKSLVHRKQAEALARNNATRGLLNANFDPSVFFWMRMRTFYRRHLEQHVFSGLQLLAGCGVLVALKGMVEEKARESPALLRTRAAFAATCDYLAPSRATLYGYAGVSCGYIIYRLQQKLNETKSRSRID